MLCFFVVTKLLMLKLLLASISGLHAYDFGYHPSAEEFDNFLRETQRTWTRDLLANEHRRAWNAKPPFRDVAEKFVPKYNYDKEQSQTATKQVTSWPGHVQRIGRPQQHRYESPSVAAAAHALKGNAVGSSLSFHLFSSEQNEDADGDGAAGEVNAADLPGVLKFSNLQPQTRPPNSKPSRPQRPNKQTLSSVIEIATSAESPKRPTQANQSFGGFYKNHTDTQFPIYFSNPVTGIIYAITEVGRVPHNISKPTSANSTISLYVSKEQYERDLYLQRKYYEQSCQSVPVKHLPKRNSTVTIAHTTTPPQIIRLQKPSTFKLPIAKLPGHLNKPPPVTVQTELTISDQVQLPTRKHKPKVKRKNKKKPNRPGRKPTVTRNELPQIIKGVRVSTPKPQTSTEKLQVATQLEKPNYTQTVFSKSPIESTEAILTSLSAKSDQSEEHQVRKRSVTNIRAYTDHAQNVTIIDKYLKDPAALHSIHEVEKVKDKSMAAKIVTARTRTAKRARVRKRQSKLGNYTEMNPLTNSAFNRTNWDVLKQHKRGYNATNSRNDTAIKPAWTNHTVNYDATTQLPSIALSTSRNNAQKRKTKSKRRRRKEKVEKRGEFDLFDFGDDEDEDDDDEESADRNDGEDDEEDDDNAGSYEDEDWSYYEFEPTSSTKTKKRKRHKNHKESKDPESFEEAEDYTDETSETSELTNHPANSIIINDGSSAEPGADFGAIESEENSLTSPPTTTTTTTTTTTKKPSIYTKAASKKRIRRRPTSSDSSASYEDYDYEDGGGVGGIGGFFRMIFYPVQVLMNGMADNFASKESDEEQYSYPTYTTYHNGIQPIESIEEEEEEQSNSLASWLSSWFGFNRRTKNIGSTTPLPPSPSPTEPPSWLESWFGFGSQTTTTDSMPEDASANDKWFFGWFDSKPRRRRKTTTTTTTVHTPAAQVPILTIVDPLKNPQNWIGILAHHIINATASTVTQNPLMNAISQATVNPDVPRKVTYDRYQIWRLKPIDDTQVHALEEYKKSEDGIKGQWLKGPSLRGLTDVLVPPKQLLDFEASLSFESIAHEVLIYDVGKAIAYEQAQEQFHFNAVMHKNKKYPQKHQQQALTTMSWHKYYEYDDIITHLEMLRMRHPQLIELIHIGRSYEGRPLVVVKIESKDHAASVASQTLVAQKKLNSKKQTKEANSVFIESGTHGLEWIGPATSLWMISELLRLIKSNKTTIDNEYIKNTTWYFMPILNPDGYVYSHKYDRFWRKTRSRHISRRNGIIDSAMTWLQQKKIATRVCYGVDLDRNWHYQWGKRGSSKSPCNELYAGPGPFSEPESKALSEFLIDYRKQIKLYISLQQYGQIISYPLKANTSFNAERIDDFLDVAMVGTDGLRKRGSKSRYKIDSTSDLVENRSGCSDAFAAYEVGIPFSFTIQLADNGVHGYLLPSASIEPTARDAFEIITAMIDYI